MFRRLSAACALAVALGVGASSAQAAAPGLNVLNDISDASIDKALGTGAGEIRLFVDWAAMEPSAPSDFTVDSSGAMNDHNLGRGTIAAIKRIKGAGRKVMVVITNSPEWASGQKNSHYPPRDPQDYANFASDFTRAAALVGAPIDDVEVWNEPEGGEFWLPGPEPARYTALLKAAYSAIKAASSTTTVWSGPTTGNNYGWVQQLYDNGAKGSFDGQSVHTDTACLVDGPDSFYKESGRIARFSFLGYREVRATMLANGEDKPIAMSELGWSSTGGNPGSCERGMFAGQKPNGVTDAVQAQFLAKAYSCLANDPYVRIANWFQFRDTSRSPKDELGRYGLFDVDGSGKPALGAFQAVAAAGGGGAGPCGDFDGPTINVISPTPNQQFDGKLDLKASATDPGSGVGRISFYADNASDEIRNFTALTDGVPVGIEPWQGSSKLALGDHTIRVVALDKIGNQSEARVKVTKVKEGALIANLLPKFNLSSKRIRCKKRVCTLSGSLSKNGKVGPSLGGKVSVAWEFRAKKGKWKRLVGGLKPANKAFTFKAKLKHRGRWRVRVTYGGSGTWKKTSSPYLSFRVR